MSKILRNLLIFYIVINFFFTAPLRFLFIFFLNADFLSYSLNAIFILLIVAYKRKAIVELLQKHYLYFAYFIVILLYSALFENFKLIGFSIYLVLPFIFFALFKDETSEALTSYSKLFVIVFIVSAIGIIWDFYADFPWKSLSYNIGGKDVDISRDWTDNSVERVAGFFRASFEAASGMIFLLVVILYNSKNIIINHLLFAITYTCVAITTTKSCLISILLIYLIYMANVFRLSNRKTILYWLMTALSIFMFVLPLGLVSDIEIPFFKNDSFKDRIFHTWPRVLDQFEHITQYFLGLGLGDIGAGQQTFGNPNLANTGDNLFIYLYGNIGIVTIAIFPLMFRRLKQIDNKIFVYMSIYLFSYAITANIVESQINQMALAVCFCLPFTFAVNNGRTEQFNLDKKLELAKRSKLSRSRFDNSNMLN